MPAGGQQRRQARSGSTWVFGMRQASRCHLGAEVGGWGAEVRERLLGQSPGVDSQPLLLPRPLCPRPFCTPSSVLCSVRQTLRALLEIPGLPAPSELWPWFCVVSRVRAWGVGRLWGLF